MSEVFYQQQPTATWNSARGVWEKQGMVNLLCAHSELFSVTWPTSGMTLNGMVFELPTQAHLTTVSESSSSPIPDNSMLRTPSAIEGQGGAISEKASREKGRMLQVRDQMVQLAAENGLKVSASVAESLFPTPTVGHLRNHDEDIEGYVQRRQDFMDGKTKGMPGASLGVAVRMELFPTPNTMEHREIKTPEQISELKAKSPGGYRNLRESVINDLMPTPTTRDFKDGTAEHERNGVVQTDTVARAVFNSGEVSTTSWGKFEPAIKRWEQVLGRPAPTPTQPDGKDGNHRLSSKFTEWMMGVPEGWITDAGLTRNDELKACGNGVVPQQAEMALRILLQDVKF